MISPTGFVHITNIDVGEFLKRKIAKFLKFRNLTILKVIRLGLTRVAAFSLSLRHGRSYMAAHDVPGSARLFCTVTSSP